MTVISFSALPSSTSAAALPRRIEFLPAGFGTTPGFQILNAPAFVLNVIIMGFGRSQSKQQSPRIGVGHPTAESVSTALPFIKPDPPSPDIAWREKIALLHQEPRT